MLCQKVILWTEVQFLMAQSSAYSDACQKLMSYVSVCYMCNIFTYVGIRWTSVIRVYKWVIYKIYKLPVFQVPL